MGASIIVLGSSYGLELRRSMCVQQCYRIELIVLTSYIRQIIMRVKLAFLQFVAILYTRREHALLIFVWAYVY
jgi:hypothetical protein